MKNEFFPDATTITAVSLFTGMDQKTIRKRALKLPVLREDGRKKYYDALALVSNVFAKEAESQKNQLTLNEAKTRYYQQLTLKVKLEREKIEDRYIDVDEFTMSQTKRYLAFKEKLLNMAARISSRVSKVSPELAQEIINNAVREALEEMVEADNARLEQEQADLENEYESGADLVESSEAEEEQDS